VKTSALIIVNKPAGVTSFDCIRRLKKILSRRDLGHAGTLDRFATGVLPIYMGEGLKLTRFFLESHPKLPSYWKTYEGVISLGRATETGDPEGAVTQELPVPELTPEKLREAAQSFVSTGNDGPSYIQTPPIYSAKHVDGERSSWLARQGEQVELKPVPVTLLEFTILRHDRHDVFFRVKCSKGTYVRVLALDFARKLGTAGYLTSLTRTAVGTYALKDTVALEELTEENIQANIKELEEAVSFLPTFELIAPELDLVRVGKVVDLCARLANSGLAPNIYCAKFDGAPMALLELDSNNRARFLRAFVKP